MTTNTLYTIFTQFNLDEREIGSFLELVKLGASPVSKWARRAKINRTSMYVLLERLSKTGLVSTFIHRNVLYAQPIGVSRILALLDDKKKEIESTRSILNSQLPELLALEKTSSIMPDVQFFAGKHRVGAMYEEVVKESSFRAFFHPTRVKVNMPEYFHKIPLAIRKNGGRAKELLVNCKEAEEYKKLYASARHHIAILPKGVVFSSDTIITKQKIYLVGYGRDTVVATEIWNEELAKTQSVIFDLVWEKYSPFSSQSHSGGTKAANR